MAMTKRRMPVKPAPDQLAKREGIFALYRDLGPTRSYERLLEAIEPKYGKVAKRTLVNWSQQHNWRARLDEHDRALASASDLEADELDPNFNAVRALERLAHMTLQRVSRSVPVVRTPQDAKAMMDVAEKSMKLAEQLRAAGKGDPEKIKAQDQLSRAVFEAIIDAAKQRHIAAGRTIQRMPDAAPTDGDVNEAAPDEDGHGDSVSAGPDNRENAAWHTAAD
jgi:hypothetical protein